MTAHTRWSRCWQAHRPRWPRSRARLGEPPGRLRRQGRPEKGEGRAFQGSLIRNAAPWGRTEGHGPGDLEGSERRPGSPRRCHRCPLLTRGTLGAPCPHFRAVPAHGCGSVRSVSDTGRQRSLLLDGNQAARGPWGRQVGSLHPESACTPSRGGRASAAPWLLGHALPQGAEDQALHEPPGGEGTGVRWAGLGHQTKQTRCRAGRKVKRVWFCFPQAVTDFQPELLSESKPVTLAFWGRMTP